MRSDYRQKLEVGPQDVDLTGVLHIEGSGFEIAALAPSWDRRGAILRVYNPNDHDATLHLLVCFKLHKDVMDGKLFKTLQIFAV